MHKGELSLTRRFRAISLFVLWILLLVFVIPWVGAKATLIGVENKMITENVLNSSILWLDFGGFMITFLIICLAFLLSFGKSQNGKYLIWGVAVLLLATPFSDQVGFVYAISVGDGFAWMMALVLFPIIAGVGLMLLLIGIFKKNEGRSSTFS